ncbi:hypothetical protein DOTSEDRAFT_68113 [Lecanosticta acicola]|uniref:Uncharacterized protein n=1 Tax=Lecanosticta acicola TaxID=111012 RepID=A0AAI8Z6W7_9PEZI|nr:hypothetical protein DOTSEDRAFT_68113 [Lecanosticta acicola]
MARKKSESPVKGLSKASASPLPAAITRSSTRQTTPSAKKAEATTSRSTKSPAKKAASPAKAMTKTTRASPAKKSPARKSPAKVTKSTKNSASPAKAVAPKRGRGRPKKVQIEEEEYEEEKEEEEEVVQSIERSPARSKSPAKQTGRAASKSAARKTAPAKSPSKSPKKLGKTPVLSPARQTSLSSRASPARSSPKAPGRKASSSTARRQADLDEEDIQQFGNSELDDSYDIYENAPLVNHGNITHEAHHIAFPSQRSKVTPRSATARAASTPATSSARKPGRPRKTTEPLDDYEEEEEIERLPPAQTRGTKKPSAVSAPAHLPFGRPSAPGRGHVRSYTNPEFIPDANGHDTDRKNPFFETMPASEIWHRRMPPIFPFGETKRMAEMYSDQINEDLNRSHEEMQAERKNPSRRSGGGGGGGVLETMSNAVGGVTSTIGNLLGAASKQQSRPSSVAAAKGKAPAAATRFNMWELPLLDSEREALASDDDGGNVRAGKRKASASSASASTAASKKRSRVV